MNNGSHKDLWPEPSRTTPNRQKAWWTRVILQPPSFFCDICRGPGVLIIAVLEMGRVAVQVGRDLLLCSEETPVLCQRVDPSLTKRPAKDSAAKAAGASGKGGVWRSLG